MELGGFEEYVYTFTGAEVAGDCFLRDKFLDFLDVLGLELCEFDGVGDAVGAAVVVEVEKATSAYMSTCLSIRSAAKTRACLLRLSSEENGALVTIASRSSAAKLPGL